MDIKTFLNKSFKSILTAAAFIEEHKQWLSCGEYSNYTKNIISKLDSGEITHISALNEINKTLFSIKIDLEKNNKLAIKKPTTSFSNFSKNYIASIFDKDGNILIDDKEEKDLVKGFDNNMRAHDWVYRKLCDAPNDSYATVVNTSTDIKISISQRMAYSQIFKRKPSAFTRKSSSGSKSGSFKQKVKNDVAKFSHG